MTDVCLLPKLADGQGLHDGVLGHKLLVDQRRHDIAVCDLLGLFLLNLRALQINVTENACARAYT